MVSNHVLCVGLMFYGLRYTTRYSFLDYRLEYRMVYMPKGAVIFNAWCRGGKIF